MVVRLTHSCYVGSRTDFPQAALICRNCFVRLYTICNDFQLSSAFCSATGPCWGINTIMGLWDMTSHDFFRFFWLTNVSRSIDWTFAYLLVITLGSFW